MHIAFGRRPRLIALGAGLFTAAAFALSASGPALADTTDTGGSGTLSVPVAVVAGLAHANIVALPGTPATSSFDPTSGTDSFTMPVTGGTGEVSNFTGKVDFGGTMVFINGANGKSMTITGIQLNFFNAALIGILPGGTKHTVLAYVRGNKSTSTSAGPPATETFTTDELDLSSKAAGALNQGLGTKAFRQGTDIGGFTTTFDVTIV
jgi:hypothetical protein